MASTEGDQAVFDRSMSGGKTNSPFLNKQWVSLPDTSNGSYRSNQSIFQTQAIANSQNWADYRNGFIAMPLVYTLTGSSVVAGNTSLDYAIVPKNSYLHMIHSCQVQLGATAVASQVNFSNIFNCFKLLTSLNICDVMSYGSTIGFYPDTALAVGFTDTNNIGTTNNRNLASSSPAVAGLSVGEPMNQGMLKRAQYINYNPTATSPAGSAYSTMLTGTACNNLYKSYVYTNLAAVKQICVTAIIRLRDLHSFFNEIPLCKNTQMTITLGLNQTIANVGVAADVLTLNSVNNPLGGTTPFMVAAATAGNGADTLGNGTFDASVYVGNQVQSQAQITAGALASPLMNQCVLWVPTYVFDATVEQAYLSSPVKRIMYTDIQSFTVPSIAPNAGFRQLISSGIAGLKSVLTVPYYSQGLTATGNRLSTTCLLSPFDSAGGTTSPFALLNNYNVQISGTPVLIDNLSYTYQTFLQQFYGCNSYNAGSQYGLGGDGLISQNDFETAYCFHYVNVSRMPSFDVSVPKSVSILGTNQCSRALDLLVFTEFGMSIELNVLTGIRTA